MIIPRFLRGSGACVLFPTLQFAGTAMRMTAIVSDTETWRARAEYWWGTLDADRGMDVLDDDEYNEGVSIMALGPTYLAVHEDGDISWGIGLPTGLHDELSGRSAGRPTVNLVCLGGDSTSYFVQFDDGESTWNVEDDFLSGFIKGSTRIAAIALGAPRAYYCRNQSGREIYFGLPKALSNILKGRQKSLPGVENVNLGAGGEWFVRFSDGDWYGGNMNDSCDEAIDQIHEDGGDVEEILFGHGTNWRIRYTK